MPSPSVPRGPARARKPRRSRQADPRDPRQRRRKKPTPEEQAQNVKFVDVLVRSGIEEELVRLTKEGWFRLLNLWILGKEDVILRIRRKSFETNFILRGEAGGRLDIREFNPEKKLPSADVLLVEEIREAVLKEHAARQE